MSNVYAIADLHGNLPEVPSDADALLVVGDICPDFGFSGSIDRTGGQQADWLNGLFRGWLTDLSDRGVQVVGIWGNHDFVGEHPNMVPRLPWTLLQDSETTIDLPDGPLRVYGTPWVPGLPYWAFFARDEALEARAGMIPDGLDVLMTHGPPYRAGDFIPTSEKQREKYGNYGGKSVGDKHLLPAICRARPKVTVCGHIHEARGSYRIEGHAVENCAAVDALYDLYPEPFVAILRH